jgi:hypothetical protein
MAIDRPDPPSAASTDPDPYATRPPAEGLADATTDTRSVSCTPVPDLSRCS